MMPLPEHQRYGTGLTSFFAGAEWQKVELDTRTGAWWPPCSLRSCSSSAPPLSNARNLASSSPGRAARSSDDSLAN